MGKATGEVKEGIMKGEKRVHSIGLQKVNPTNFAGETPEGRKGGKGSRNRHHQGN